MHEDRDLGLLALRYHQRLPIAIRSQLNQFGLPNWAICRYRLGWNGKELTIPITNRWLQVKFFRLAVLSPSDGGLEVTSSSGAYPELYGWERLRSRDWVVVCDGEFDRLILEAHGIPSVTSTGGPANFLEQWLRALYLVKTV